MLALPQAAIVGGINAKSSLTPSVELLYETVRMSLLSTYPSCVFFSWGVS